MTRFDGARLPQARDLLDEAARRGDIPGAAEVACRVNPAGDLMAAAFSHTGFTGTPLRIDPGLGLFFAVLPTNGVHLGRAGTAAAVQRLRPPFHNAAVAAMEG